MVTSCWCRIGSTDSEGPSSNWLQFVLWWRWTGKSSVTEKSTSRICQVEQSSWWVQMELINGHSRLTFLETIFNIQIVQKIFYFVNMDECCGTLIFKVISCLFEPKNIKYILIKRENNVWWLMGIKETKFWILIRKNIIFMLNSQEIEVKITVIILEILKSK